MKKFAIKLFLFVFVLPNMTQAQEHKVQIGMQLGNYYSDPNETNLSFGHNLAFNIDYFLSNRFILTTHINYGKSRYYDESYTNVPEWNVQKDNTNSELFDINACLMFGYKYPITQWMSISGSVGVGSFTHKRTYYWDYNQPQWDPFDRELSITDLAFPVKISLGVIPTKHLEIAFVSGFYYEPDYPIVGLYYGPQISYCFY